MSKRLCFPTVAITLISAWFCVSAALSCVATVAGLDATSELASAVRLVASVCA